MPAPNNQLELIKMYLAAFIRAPERSGLDYWMGQLATGKSFSNMLETVFSLDIVRAIYPLDLPNVSFVTLIYVNVFGKSPDLEGLNYWAHQLDTGLSRGELVMVMINTGLSTPDGTPGKAYIVNRLAAAQFAVDQQYAQGADLSPAYLKSVMSNVTSDPASVVVATRAVNSSVTGIGLGAPLNSLFVGAASNGISAAEVKAGVAVTVDLKGTNAAINNTVEILLNRASFSTPIMKTLSDADIKAQKLDVVIPNSINWGADGSKVLSLVVRDASGNASLPGGDATVELNVIAPNSPTKPITIPVAVNGINSAEKSAGVQMIVDLAGSFAQVGDRVEVLLGGQVMSPAASAIVSSADLVAGKVSVVVSGAANWGADGEKIFSARVVDVAGNVGGIGGGIAVTLDATVPSTISASITIDAGVGGINPAEKAANMNVVVNLTNANAQAGDAIELLIDNKPFASSTLHVLTATELSTKTATLIIAGGDTGWGDVDGEKIISARIVDAAGNTGAAGGALKVTIDSTAPNSQNTSLSIAAAQNGINAAEVTAGVAVVVNLLGTGAAAGDTINILIGGLAFNPAVTAILSAADISAKAVTLTIPKTVNWGADGNKTLTASIVDSAGNIGSPGSGLSVLIDQKAPNAPTNALSIPAALNGINISEKLAGVGVSIDLTGTNAVAGDTVELLLGGVPFTAALLQILVAADITAGTVGMMIPNSAAWGVDGIKNISARVIDSAGNQGQPSSNIALNLDTVAPAGPTNILAVAANGGGGISPAERTAGVDVVINLTGTTVVAGDSVEILLGGVAFTTPVLHVLTANEVLVHSATATIGTAAGWGLDGSKVLTARFVDVAGNQGTAGGSLTVNLDGTAPGLPNSAILVPAATGGISSAEKTAGVAVTVDLTNTGAVAGDVVNIYIDGLAFATPVNTVLTAGQITAKQAILTIPSGAGWGADGSKVLTANVVDSLGNAGSFGGSVTVVLDTIAPTAVSNPVVIAASTNNINASEQAGGVNVQVFLSGAGAVAGDKVELLLAGAAWTTPVIATLIASDITNGFVNIAIPSSAGWGADGNKVISARVIDAAGNLGANGGGITVTLDTLAPNAPGSTLTVPANGGGGITAAEKNAGVAVTISLTGSNTVAGDTVEILLAGAAFTTPVTHVITAGEITGQSASVTIASGAGWGSDGAKTLTARFLDTSGNVGSAGGSISVTILDTVPPNAPSSAVSSVAASGGINAAEKTAGLAVVGYLAGTLAVAGDTMELFIDGASFASPVTHVISSSDITAGNYTFTVATGAGWGSEGSHILSMGVTDVAGNVGTKGGNLTVNLDTIAPTAPTNALVAAAAASGINSSEKTVGVVTTVDLTGTGAVAGDSIEILIGGLAFALPVLHVLTAGEITAGNANATIASGAGWGADGVKTLSSRVIDIAGNVGVGGGSLTTSLDTTMPAASGLPTYSDVNASGTINSGDTYVFAISEATTKTVGIGNMSVNNSHIFGTGATAVWNVAGTQLTLTLGTGANLQVGDTVTLIGISDAAGNMLNLAFTI